MKRHLLILLCFLPSVLMSNPVSRLIDRLDAGASRHFIIEKRSSSTDYFELESRQNKIVVRGNTYVNISAGIHWYLKHYLHTMVSWNNMKVDFPDILPRIPHPERHEAAQSLRYDFNYCTHSYSMAFWDWERWEREIDWMALHGINLPLAITGTECVWRNVLLQLGYTQEEVNQFVSGPAFFAWWLMNNLEGWGGPLPHSWYDQRLRLQQQIVKRMRELDIEPVFAGYSGMLPHNARQKLGVNVADPGLWCGYSRPSFLQPTDPRFAHIAHLYYKEMTRLFGRANYYSMDPFHEGGSDQGVQLSDAGLAIMKAMKRANPKAVWVIQAWGENPRRKMIEQLPQGDLLVLDLFSESRPQWGDEASSWHRKEGFYGHDWVYCMLLNFGGNVGLHGKMQHLVDEYFKAKSSPFSSTLKGVGMTMEGIENNPVMYELLTELPWRPAHFNKEDWLRHYVTCRYGQFNETLYQAWLLLSNSVYACPAASVQQGTHESIFCARPSDHVYQVSTWSDMTDYYDPHDVLRAARLFTSVAHQFQHSDNYDYDRVDLLRQANAEKGRMIYGMMMQARKLHHRSLFIDCSRHFMQLLHQQDSLLSTRKEFRLDTWTSQASRWGQTEAEKSLYVWNAKVQITTWGNRLAADKGGLHDYAHREWSGLLSTYYAPRWQKYIDTVLQHFYEAETPPIDFYPMEERWTRNE